MSLCHQHNSSDKNVVFACFIFETLRDLILLFQENVRRFLRVCFMDTNEQYTHRYFAVGVITGL